MDCCVFVVVTVVTGGGTDVVLVRSMVVVRVGGSDEQAASSVVKPRSVKANNSRVQVFVSVMMSLLSQSWIRSGPQPIRQACYRVVVVAVSFVVVTVAGCGNFVVLVTESVATPSLFR